MYDEHFSLEIDFRYLRPPEVLYALAHRERADTWEVDADIELRAAIILHRVWIDAVGLEASCDDNELVVDRDDVLTGFTLSMRLNHFFFQLEWLTKREFQRRNVILGVHFPFIVAELVCKRKQKEKFAR